VKITNNDKRADGKLQKYTTDENQSHRQITKKGHQLDSAEFTEQEADNSLRFAQVKTKHGHQPLI
jgi:hypothetical protein